MEFAASQDPRPRFEQAVAIAEPIVAAITPRQLDLPTPCTEWSVRTLLDHVVGGNLVFEAWLMGAEPPDQDADHLGDAPLEAFRQSVDRLETAFRTEGVLEREFTTPMGTLSGSTVVTMRFVDLLVHTWDLARATGQSTALDAELCHSGLRILQHMQPPRGENAPFGVEQPVPDDAPPADKLAGFAGRSVT